jgi:hypothetical protein
MRRPTSRPIRSRRRSDPAVSAPAPLTWRTPLRLALRFGPPLAGIVVLAAAGVAAIGGDIRPLRFALGLGLILLGLAGGLVKGR